MAIIARSFLGVALPAAGNLATAPGGEHERVPLVAGRQDVTQAAVSDVVGPTVSTDDPDALLDQRVGDREKVTGVRRVDALEPRFQNPDALALFPDPRLGRLAGVEEIPDQFVPDGRCQAREQLARIFSLLVQSQTDAQPAPRG